MDRNEMARLICQSLTEFGYAGLTTENVRESVDRAFDGQEPRGIIDMMTKSQLQEAGVL